jgi:hypothetical protein
MEAIWSSETSVDFQRTARRYTPGDRTLQEILLFEITQIFITPCIVGNFSDTDHEQVSKHDAAGVLQFNLLL